MNQGIRTKAGVLTRNLENWVITDESYFGSKDETMDVNYLLVVEDNLKKNLVSRSQMDTVCVTFREYC
jgi:hypothetical protein